MVFNFTVETLKGTERGVCTAPDAEAATQFVREQFNHIADCDLTIDVEPGVEQFLDENYGGFAILTNTI